MNLIPQGSVGCQSFSQYSFPDISSSAATCLQAMDRAHRLGQKRTVNVYRLLMRDSLEERIMGLQRFKLDVASAVINQVPHLLPLTPVLIRCVPRRNHPILMAVLVIPAYQTILQTLNPITHLAM